MQSDHDGMGHIGPVDGIGDPDVAAAAVVAQTSAVDGGAVVAGAAEHVVVTDVVGREYIHAIAPPVPTHDLGIAHLYGVAATDRELRGERSVHEHVLAVADADA